jgi:two-component sensor histidine kinase
MKRIEMFAAELLAAFERRPVLKYVAAGGAAVAALLARAVLAPVIGPGGAYFLYLPVIAAVTYVLGAGPGLLAVAICGFGSYFSFSQPAFEIKMNVRTNARLGLFLLNGAIVVAAISHILRRLGRLEEALAKASDLTQTQAELFRDHAERVAGHLQLLSALLQLRARDEGEADYARVLMNASSRTLLISRLHRSFATSSEERFAFSGFAQRLADAALEARGRPPLVISMEGELALYPEQATSLALMLLECIKMRADQGKPGRIRINFAQDAREGVLTLSEKDPPADGYAPDSPLLRALAEQMGGRLLLGRTKEQGVVRFAFPIDLQPLPAWDPLQALH